MKPTTIVFALTFLLTSAAVCLADNPHMGTWKLNEAKSKLGAGTVKNHTVIYVAAGDNTKITVDGVDAEAKPTHSEWTGKFDGKYYPVTGDPTADTRMYKQQNARTLSFTAKKGAKVTLTGRIVVSIDGKTRTVTTNTTNSSGKSVSSKAVYDKQ